MRKKSDKTIAGVPAGLLAAAVMLLVPGLAFDRQEPPPPSGVPAGPPQAVKGDPKVEHALFVFQHIHHTRGMDGAREYALRRGLDMEGDKVLVMVEAETSLSAERGGDPAPVVMGQVRLLGGAVEARYQELVQARMPAEGLLELAANPLVRFVRSPLKPQTQAVTSEGVVLTGADRWRGLAPYRNSSAGLKVCVLDLGFRGYASLLGSELPSSVKTRSFRTDGSLEANQPHGTGCAEVVHDMMPDAELYLVNFSTELQHRQAVDWLISEGVDVVSYSIAWFNAGDGRGTGPICETVKKASDNGIVWVAAAGNFAEDHWEGTFGDGDGDRYHNFAGADEILHFWVPANTPVSAYLNWDDWGSWNGASYVGSSQDYDLELYYWNGSSWMFVDGSYNGQTGTQWPVESIGNWYSTASTYWGLAVYRWSTTRNCRLELFVRGNSDAVEYNVPEGSLSVPADSAYGIAVGATDAVADAYHSYSSRGPTHDGRVKPDFCAPSGVSSYTYGARGFYGTSAATPHMAGGLALMKAITPYSWTQVRTILEDRAVDMGASGKDNIYGSGRLNLKR